MKLTPFYGLMTMMIRYMFDSWIPTELWQTPLNASSNKFGDWDGYVHNLQTIDLCFNTQEGHDGFSPYSYLISGGNLPWEELDNED